MSTPGDSVRLSAMSGGEHSQLVQGVAGMDIIRENVLSLSHFLGWDSTPFNWLLFRLQKQTVPVPGEGSVLLWDSKWYVPEAAKAAMEESQIGQLISRFGEPSLMMIELRQDDFLLGSYWSFIGGLPEVNGRANSNFAGYNRVRFLTYMSELGMVIIFTTEVTPGVIAFSKVEELDARHAAHTVGLINAGTEKVTLRVQTISRRSCDECAGLNRGCDPSTCQNEQDFEMSRAVRQLLISQPSSNYSQSALDYQRLFTDGAWTGPLGNRDPMITVAKCYSKGALFDAALLSIVQNEISAVLPPRSSFRIVSEEWNQMQYYQALEDASGSSVEGFSRGKVRDVEPSPRSSGTAKQSRTCEICMTTFRRNYDLKRHWTAVHENRRDFECPTCGKTYTQKGHLREHIRSVHTDDTSFQCRICKKRFGVQSKLERHVTTVHDSNRAFHCILCSRSYKEKSSLSKHLLKHHKIRNGKG
uniref:C2H2-type domain-containing protein n=1 Tax=Rhodosorus marinus TaxID=101924 RepID=A0A7S3EEA3_9RHOD|mmetsp:Transcript_25609/g.101058  ORF Transcript_25609/g.101058 Transcript_25609/m.101058 type:complete len:472 (+) Transcript_25609:151-1566(+)